MTHELPKLDYSYDALEPHIDAKTMEIHHGKHHQAYVDKLNAAIAGTDLEGKSAEDLIKDLSAVPETIRAAVQNNGGGHVNHSFFWPLLKKDVPLQGDVKEAIQAKWGSVDEFKKEFSNAAVARFGSGWAWLVCDEEGELSIMSTPNQDNPISQGKTPILGLDVWEHGYYLLYQNRRPDYINAFWNVVNWELVNEHYSNAQQ